MVQSGPRAKIAAGARVMSQGVVIVVANEAVVSISALTQSPTTVTRRCLRRPVTSSIIY